MNWDMKSFLSANRRYKIPMGNSLKGVLSIPWWEKLQFSPFISEMVLDRSVPVPMNLNGGTRGVRFFRISVIISKMTHVGSDVFLQGQPIPLSQRAGPRHTQIFGTPTYAHTVRPRATKFGMVTCGRSVFFRDHPRPHPKGRGLTVPKIFGTSCMRGRSMRNIDQIFHDDQARCEEIFTGSIVAKIL